MNRFSIIVLILFQSSRLFSQVYTPMDVYDENSNELIYELRQQKKNEIRFQNYPPESDHSSTYRRNTLYLIELVKNEYLINDTELNKLVESIRDRLSNCNPSIRPIKKILIKKDGFLNATSFGEGTVTINIGLIANAKSIDELAFIIAHETAHFHLNHLRDRIESHIGNSSYGSVKRRLNKIPDGNLTIEDLEFVQSWFNNLFYHSRENELDADSLALRIYENCNFDSDGPLTALINLKHAYHPFIPLKRKLFDEFIFDELPFKKRWLDARKIEITDNPLEHLINNDSIQTHPNIDQRIQKINEQLKTENQNISYIPKGISDRSKLEVINSFYKNKFYDFGIHTALQLKQIYKSTSHIDFQISRMLYEIAFAKNDNRLQAYVRSNTDLYPDETKALNYFFYNLSTAEAAEISYLFCKKNFDPTNPDHYRILHKINTFTNRLADNKKLRKEFKKQFSGQNIRENSDRD